MLDAADLKSTYFTQRIGVIMKLLENLLLALAVPLILVNTFGGVVSGVWLAFQGQWAAIGLGILSYFFAHFLLSLVLAPGMLIALPGVKLLEKEHLILAVPFFFLGSLYTAFILSVWCMGTLSVFSQVASSVPMLLWSYSVAMGPISWMAQKEIQAGGGDASAITTSFASLGYMLIMVGILALKWTIETAALFFAAVMLIGTLVQFTLALLAMRTSRQEMTNATYYG